MTDYAKLVVVDCGPAFAKVKVRSFVDLMESRVSLKFHAEVEPASDHKKCRIEAHAAICKAMRLADGAPFNELKPEPIIEGLIDLSKKADA